MHIAASFWKWGLRLRTFSGTWSCQTCKLQFRHTWHQLGMQVFSTCFIKVIDTLKQLLIVSSSCDLTKIDTQKHIQVVACATVHEVNKGSEHPGTEFIRCWLLKTGRRLPFSFGATKCHEAKDKMFMSGHGLWQDFAAVRVDLAQRRCAARLNFGQFSKRPATADSRRFTQKLRRIWPARRRAAHRSHGAWVWIQMLIVVSQSCQGWSYMFHLLDSLQDSPLAFAAAVRTTHWLVDPFSLSTSL